LWHNKSGMVRSM